ncbi:MAG TPA: hypothetical protein VG899_00830 [Mycobacteriales bacterium]|nr:hypothetical protein [Mycobacteriales bacterium]HWB66406.1 hypothetical protein [Mycobacteriales bacterium]
MRRRLTHALSAVFEGDAPAPLAVKVPQITVLFWVIKVTSTAMGEALADWLDGGNGLVWPALGAIASLAALIVALRIQFRTRAYQTAAYWFAIAMVATFGTMGADSLHQFLGIPYGYTTAFYAVVLALVFWRWWVNEHTLSIHTIDSRRRERFYWATVLATFALGTATGDWTATDLKLGFFSSGLMFLGVIAIPAIAYRFGANPIFTFWSAYVITRPLGASFADWADYPKSAGGLGFGTWPVWMVLAVVMTTLVAVLARRERDAVTSRPHHAHPHAPHPHLPHPHLPGVAAVETATD